MASSYDFSILDWEKVLAKIHEVKDLCAKCALKQETLLAHFNSLSNSSSTKSHSTKNDIAIPPVNNHLSHDDPIDDDPSPLPLTIWASNHENLSFTRLVLSSSTLRTLVPLLSCPLRTEDLFQDFPSESSIITPHISVVPDTTDNDFSTSLPVPSLNCESVISLPSVPASTLLYNDAQ
ncbi:unnamed protein product [Rhizophagus irregularis]|uniref:Uncharacterized protein n=1 Tax=Rhizophagus irregularis TaxID=588596 RepID=A0A2I1H382_9GLOM|nr:hypothetical protein RhiirA4_471478 [Rhizophagus irregularis]CAB4406086.1 unnamed protein product [Rhizophagus irregularis]